MPSMSDIRFHIKSVKQTRQITNAMHLVSAARMRRALRAIYQNQPYFLHQLDAIIDIRVNTGEAHHPYINHREGSSRAAYIVVAGEKGLSGSYNHDVLALAEKSMQGREITRLFTVGGVATQFFARRGMQPDTRFERLAEKASVMTTRRLVTILMELYDRDEIDEVRIVYTRFINTLQHEPIDQKLLPIELDDFVRYYKRPIPTDRATMVYDPSYAAVLDALIPQFIIGYVYGAMVHSYASENCARMTAMENATRSADEMISKLTLQYNSVRQLSITNELADIIGAANAANDAAEDNA